VIRRTTKLMIEGAAAAVGGVVVLVAVAVWLFSSGPISIDFLTPYIEAALATPDGTLRLKFDRTLLAWEGWERTIDMRATHVRAYDDKGRLVATFPEIALNLSARALVHGVVAPSMLEVVGAQVRLKRDANGQFELAFSLPEGGSQAGAAALPIPLPHLPVQSDKGPSGVVPMMLQELLHSPDPDKPTGYLRRVSVRDADLVVDDSHWDTSWKAKLSRLSLERDARSIRGTAAIDVVVEGDTSHFLLNGLYHDASSAVALDIGFANVRPALFARAIPILEPLARLKLPLDGTVATRLGLAGGLDQLSFQVMGGPGAVAVPELYPEDVALSNFEARGSLGENATSITLDTMRLDLGGPVITIAGTVSPATAAWRSTCRSRMCRSTIWPNAGRRAWHPIRAAGSPPI